MKKQNKISPEEAVRYLEDMRLLFAQTDLPTVPISLRIPKNILHLLKVKAKMENKKYQSLIIEYIRAGLEQR